MTKPKSEATKVGPIRIAPHIRDGEPSGRWQIDLPPHIAPSGKRTRLNFETKTAAVTEAKRLLRELQLDGAIRGHGPKLSGVTLEEVSKRWLAEQADRVETMKKRTATLITDGYKLKALLTKFAHSDVAKIAAADINDYQKERLKAGRKPPTINGEVALLKQLLSWCYDNSLIERVPKIEQIPVPKKRVELPTTNEAAQLIDALPPRLALLIRFLAETGCRKGEAFTLEWADIVEHKNLVMIRRKEGFTPKTEQSDRDIPIDSYLMADLTAAKKAARVKAMSTGEPMPTLVFPGRFGGRMHNFSKALKTAITKAGLGRDGVPLHLNAKAFRKSHITWQKERGVPDALLQPRVGHAPGSKMTAAVYTHVTSEAEKGIVLRLPKGKESA